MGIRGKFVVSTLVLAVLIGIGPILYTLDAQRSVVYGEFEHRGLIVCEELVETLTVMEKQLGSISHLPSLRAALQEPDLVHGYILDVEGWILSDGAGKDLRRGQRHEGFDQVRDRVMRMEELVARRDASRIHISGPVYADGELQGFVHLVVSLRRADLQVRKTVEMAALVAGVALVPALLFSFLIAHRFAQPVMRMLAATKRIKKGDYSVSVPVRSDDELGMLTAQINDVATSLRDTTVSHNYVNDILQSMVDTLIVVDTEAVIVTVNHATLHLLGYEESQLIGKPAGLVCIDEGYQLTGTRLMHLLGESARQDHELTYRTSGGMLIPISFSGSPIREHSGEVAGYVCIGKDITDRKRAEMERAQLNQQLVETSRHAGMAEVATGVLHNVGNVLNSVNMSASMVSDTVKRSKIAGLTQAIDLINQHANDLARFFTEDERGRQLPTYLHQLSGHLEKENLGIATEIESLTKNINHIREIISAQQSYSKLVGFREAVSLPDLIEESLRLKALNFDRHGVRVRRDCSKLVPEIKTDKHKLLQILVNLVTNANDAVMEAGGDKKLTVRLVNDDANGRVLIEVTDNGVGIAEENLTTIFNHGFTTKKNGHGFGLHSAALTAKELGGDLSARSDGPGKGATFTLSLPLSQAGVEA